MTRCRSFGGGLAAAVLGGALSALETLQSAPVHRRHRANTTNAFPAGPLRPNVVGDPGTAGERAHAEPLVQHGGVCEPRGLHLRNSPRRRCSAGRRLATLDATVEKSIASAQE